jgi:hypothetical protein
VKKNKKYLKAAKLLIRNKEIYGYTSGCCFVLEMVKKDDYEFHAIFKPEYARTANHYFGNVREDENILARSLALLLMYEMGEEPLGGAR